MASDIPDPILRFFEAKIDSIELVHVLMLLFDRPEERWTIEKISGELRSSESSVAKRVETLVGRGVISRASVEGETVKYVPFDAEMGRTVQEALAYYKTRPYRMVELVFSNRTNTIRSIADAFRFRKED